MIQNHFDAVGIKSYLRGYHHRLLVMAHKNGVFLRFWGDLILLRQNEEL